jgi:3-phosphoshikimate 1-carboxyvinyltransferase
MNDISLKPVQMIQGQITLPGSKSLSNRALLLAALCPENTQITNLLDSDDVEHMLQALKTLGFEYNQNSNGLFLKGNPKGMPAGQFDLFLGNAGTAMRPLCAALSCGAGSYRLHGEPRMHQRPVGDLVEALIKLGARISYEQQPGFPPLLIQGQHLPGGKTSVDGRVSSQFLTALLMAAPLMKNEVQIEVLGDLVSKPYIDITLNMMSVFGVKVRNDSFKNFVIPQGSNYHSPGHYAVEGDASGASYFLAAAAIKGGTLRVSGAGKSSIQGDIQFAEVLRQMGARVQYGDDYIEVSKGDLKAVDLDLNHIPDAAMTLATTALFAHGTTTIRNVANWRVKETDRLSAMATELRKTGALITEGPDFLSITPPPQGIQPCTIDTYNDHRIAMCFSLLSLSNSPVTINDPSCVSKTYPQFFKDFAGVCYY